MSDSRSPLVKTLVVVGITVPALILTAAIAGVAAAVAVLRDDADGNVGEAEIVVEDIAGSDD